MAYRGDVFPYVPIATELSRRGHDVTYVVPDEFHPILASEPFRCASSGTDFGPTALDEHASYVARWGKVFGGAMLLRLYFGVFTVPHLDALFGAIDAEIANADLLLSHPAAAVIGGMSCERRGVPWVVGDLFPMLVPTSTGPPAGMPNLGPRINDRLWKLGRSPKIDRLTSGDAFVAFRKQLGLPAPAGWNVVDARLSPTTNLGLMSSHYIAARPDWPTNYELTGFTPWDGPENGALPADVEAFLTAGDPPVVVTLGTSAASAKPEVFARVAASLNHAGRRGIFLTSTAAIARDFERQVGPNSGHGVWPFVPLAPLLARATAIVHSGAHGTNALALAAGVPSAVFPVLFDQLWHARRQQELGTGVWVKHRRNLDAAVHRICTDAALEDRARAVGALVAAEDGTGVACDRIEQALSGS